MNGLLSGSPHTHACGLANDCLAIEWECDFAAAEREKKAIGVNKIRSLVSYTQAQLRPWPVTSVSHLSSKMHICNNIAYYIGINKSERDATVTCVLRRPAPVNNRRMR